MQDRTKRRLRVDNGGCSKTLVGWRRVWGPLTYPDLDPDLGFGFEACWTDRLWRFRTDPIDRHLYCFFLYLPCYHDLLCHLPGWLLPAPEVGSEA